MVELGKRERAAWSVPILVGQIPAAGLHKTIAPNAQEAEAIAALGGLLHATGIRADLKLTPLRGERVRVEGRVTGKVGQTCVVTLDPLDADVDEDVELEFAPAEQVRALSASVEEPGDDDDSERPDPPEPIENDIIDLGKIATDAIFLGLDPYPRKPGASFEQPAGDDHAAEHPFAALQALKSHE